MAYQGLTVTIPIGMHGFTGSKNPTQMMPSHLPYVEGVTLEAGVLQKDGGADLLNTTPAGTDGVNRRVMAGTSWWGDDYNRYDIILLDNGQVLRGTVGSFPTTLVTLPNAIGNTINPAFVSAGGETVGAVQKLFLFSAENQLHVTNGTTASMAAVTTVPSDWTATVGPTFGIIHEGRLWAGGNASDPHRVYVSAIGNHADFSTSVFTLPVFPGEGQRLVGGVSFKGKLILFKYPIGIYIIDTSDPNSTNWRTTRLTRSVGAASHQAIVHIDNDVLYMDPGGNIHMLSATTALGGVNTSNISQLHDLGPFIRETANFNAIQKTVGTYYAAKRRVWFVVPMKGSSVPNLRVEVDLNDLQVGPRFLLSRRDVVESLWLRPDALNLDKPTFGSTGGQVWLGDSSGRDKNDTGYTFRLETAETDLAFADPMLGFKQKTGQFLEVTFEPTGDWNLDIMATWDGAESQVIPINMKDPSGAALGAFVLSTDGLGVGGIITVRERLVGSGRRIKFAMENSGAGQNVQIASVSLSFSVDDERVRS